MVTIEKDGKTKLAFEFAGEGEHLLRVQKALLLGINVIGSHDHSGYEDHQRAVWILSDLLRQCLLDESQTNMGLGGKPYKSDLKKNEGQDQEKGTIKPLKS